MRWASKSFGDKYALWSFSPSTLWIPWAWRTWFTTKLKKKKKRSPVIEHEFVFFLYTAKIIEAKPYGTTYEVPDARFCNDAEETKLNPYHYPCLRQHKVKILFHKDIENIIFDKDNQKAKSIILHKKNPSLPPHYKFLWPITCKVAEYHHIQPLSLPRKTTIINPLTLFQTSWPSFVITPITIRNELGTNVSEIPYLLSFTATKEKRRFRSIITIKRHPKTETI